MTFKEIVEKQLNVFGVPDGETHGGGAYIKVLGRLVPISTGGHWEEDEEFIHLEVNDGHRKYKFKVGIMFSAGLQHLNFDPFKARNYRILGYKLLDLLFGIFQLMPEKLNDRGDIIYIDDNLIKRLKRYGVI